MEKPLYKWRYDWPDEHKKRILELAELKRAEGALDWMSALRAAEDHYIRATGYTYIGGGKIGRTF